MTPFNLSHQQEYGFQISKLDTVTRRIIVVACKFCIAFGRKSKIGAKRQKTITKKTFGLVFCIKNYLIHLKSKHPIRWKEYQSFFKESKLIYFDIEVPFVNTILSHLNWDTDHITYTIDKGIVEFIIGEILWDLEDYEDQTYENAMHAFTLDTHTDNYSITIKTQMAYQLAINYIDIGISLSHNALVLHATN